MIAYKFLSAGRTGPFTRFRWPLDQWIDADGLEECRRGIHACSPRQLPYWLGEELWEVELDGELVTYERKLVAARGRLVRRLEDWGPPLVDAFVADLLRRTRAGLGSIPGVSGYVEDIERFRAGRRVGLAAFAAARAAEHDGGPRAYDRERERQAAWLAQRLGLEPVA